MDAGGVFVIWFGLAAGVGFLADSRGRSGFGFFLLSAVLSPLLGLIIVLVMSNTRLDEAKAEDQRREHERQLESIRAIAAPAAQSANQAAAAATSVADELIKLGQLKEKGLLTEDEFAVQKARLLAV